MSPFIVPEETQKWFAKDFVVLGTEITSSPYGTRFIRAAFPALIFGLSRCYQAAAPTEARSVVQQLDFIQPMIEASLLVCQLPGLCCITAWIHCRGHNLLFCSCLFMQYKMLGILLSFLKLIFKFQISVNNNFFY